jgi:hypothetical protein
MVMNRRVEPTEKHARLGKRLPLQCSLVIANDVQVGEGWVFDLSMRGCLVEGSVRVRGGDRLQLRFCLPDSHPSICMSVAVVRWAQNRSATRTCSEINRKGRRFPLSHWLRTMLGFLPAESR